MNKHKNQMRKIRASFCANMYRALTKTIRLLSIQWNRIQTVEKKIAQCREMRNFRLPCLIMIFFQIFIVRLSYCGSALLSASTNRFQCMISCVFFF